MSNQEPPTPPPSDFGGTPPPPPPPMGTPPQAPGAAYPPAQPTPQAPTAGYTTPPPVQQAPPPPFQQAPPPPGQVPFEQPAGFPGQDSMHGAKPPRPAVKVGAILVIAGAVLSLIATFLPWATVGDNTGNGYDLYRYTDGFSRVEVDRPGVFVVVIAVISLGLGLALLFAGRVLAVAIIAIVVAVIAVFVGLAMLGLMGSFADDNGGDLGIGAILQPITPLLSLAGAITATAKRRRWQ